MLVGKVIPAIEARLRSSGMFCWRFSSSKSDSVGVGVGVHRVVDVRKNRVRLFMRIATVAFLCRLGSWEIVEGPTRDTTEYSYVQSGSETIVKKDLNLHKRRAL